jgi:hypothetical protein
LSKDKGQNYVGWLAEWSPCEELAIGITVGEHSGNRANTAKAHGKESASKAGE